MHEGAGHDVNAVMDGLDKAISDIWTSSKNRAVFTPESPKKDF